MRIGRSVSDATQGLWMCMHLFLGALREKSSKRHIVAFLHEQAMHIAEGANASGECVVLEFRASTVTFLAGNPWCLGLASSGQGEAPYHRVGHDMRKQGRSGHQPPWHPHWFLFVGRSSFASGRFHTYGWLRKPFYPFFLLVPVPHPLFRVWIWNSW